MARVRTNKNICLYCFGDLDSDRICMSCHRKADDAPSPPHHLPQRTVLGTQNRYLIGKALGEGGFGITYLAWDLQQGIKVAVKEYFPSGYVTRVAASNQVIINSKQNQAASNRGLKRFVEEARALAKIKNLSGVVNVRDFFSANGTAYIVMEFLDGVSLKKYLQRKGGKLAVDELLTIIRPVMESLTQVHKLGLIHRDISPDNILITKHNEVKLIDFGAAKYSNPDGRSLSVVLKQGFAPPEQYDTHGEQGPWTDVYALGVTIYYAVTGTLPPESIRVMMGKETIKRPSEMGVEIDAGVENALMKSLAVDIKKRYQDVQSMINGLYNPSKPRKSVGSVTAAPAAAPKKTAVSRTAAITPSPTDKHAQQRPAFNMITSSRSSLPQTNVNRLSAENLKKATAKAAENTKRSTATTPSASTARSTPAATSKATAATPRSTQKAGDTVKRPAASNARATANAADTKRASASAGTAKPSANGKRNAGAAEKPTAKTPNAKVVNTPASANKQADDKKTPQTDRSKVKTTGSLFSRLFKK